MLAQKRQIAHIAIRLRGTVRPMLYSSYVFDTSLLASDLKLSVFFNSEITHQYNNWAESYYKKTGGCTPGVP